MEFEAGAGAAARQLPAGCILDSELKEFVVLIGCFVSALLAFRLLSAQRTLADPPGLSAKATGIRQKRDLGQGDCCVGVVLPVQGDPGGIRVPEIQHRKITFYGDSCGLHATIKDLSTS